MTPLLSIDIGLYTRFYNAYSPEAVRAVVMSSTCVSAQYSVNGVVLKAVVDDIADELSLLLRLTLLHQSSGG